MNNINLSLKVLTENPLVPFIVRLSTETYGKFYKNQEEKQKC